MTLRTRAILVIAIAMILSSCNLLRLNSVTEDFTALNFDTEEMTAPHIDISPDGNTILFDVLGDLYTVPVEGGLAKLLIGGNSWDVKAKYSPDGKKIGFLSDRDGLIGLWEANANGSHLKKQKSYRPKSWDHIRAFWNTNRNLIEYSEDSWFKLVNNNRILIQFNSTAEDNMSIYYHGAIFPEGDSLYYPKGGKIHCLNIASGHIHEVSIVDEEKRIPKSIKKLQIDPLGKSVAFLSNVPKENYNDPDYVNLNVLNMQNRRVKSVVDSIPANSVLGYSFTNNGENIIISHQGKLKKVNIETGKKVVIPVTVPIRKKNSPFTTASEQRHKRQWKGCD